MKRITELQLKELNEDELKNISGGYGLLNLWKDFLTGVFLDAAWDTVVAWWEAAQEVETVDIDATKLMQKRLY